MRLTDCLYHISFRSCGEVAKSSKKVVFEPPICRGGIPQILDMRFQISLISDHVADFVEFRSASSEIRGRKKKESVVKYKSADIYAGRPNN